MELFLLGGGNYTTSLLEAVRKAGWALRWVSAWKVGAVAVSWW